MSFGQPKNTTTTTKVELTPQQNELLDLALPGLRDFAGANLTPRTATGTAPFNPQQVQGQEAALAAAGGQQDLANKAATTNSFLLGDVLKPESNPALQDYIDAAVRPITERYTEVTRPDIASEATRVGQLGSSKHGVLEARGQRDYLRQVADTTAGITSNAYGQGLEALTKGLALVPQTTVNLAQPASTISAVGDVRQSQAINDSLAQEALLRENELLPFTQAQSILGSVNSIPGAGATVSQPLPQQNPLTSILGAGLTAASFIPGLQGLGIAGATAGAGAGGIGKLLGYL